MPNTDGNKMFNAKEELAKWQQTFQIYQEIFDTAPIPELRPIIVVLRDMSILGMALSSFLTEATPGSVVEVDYDVVADMEQLLTQSAKDLSSHAIKLVIKL
jgi:hypothetical protein